MSRVGRLGRVMIVAAAALALVGLPLADVAGQTATADVPVGTEIDVRLQSRLSSGTARVEDRFEATTIANFHKGDRVVIRAGSLLRGVVTSVEKAGRLDRKGSLTLSFDRITVNGHAHRVRALVTQAIESKGVKGEAGTIGAGAGVGAVVGGLLGGVKGAIAGILIGAGGVIAAKPGHDVELPAGTVLRIRFDAPLTID